ncbi:MAG: hypothetical protein ACRCX2_32230 [Paraclostridium sp.]
MLKVKECILRDRYKDVNHIVNESISSIFNMLNHIKECGCDGNSSIYEQRLGDLLTRLKIKKECISTHTDGHVHICINDGGITFNLKSVYINETGVTDSITNISTDITFEDYLDAKMGTNYIESCKFVDILAIGNSGMEAFQITDRWMTANVYGCIIAIDDIYMKFMSELKSKGKTDAELMEYLTSAILTKMSIYIENLLPYIAVIRESSRVLSGIKSLENADGYMGIDNGKTPTIYDKLSLKQLANLMILLYVNNTLNGRYEDKDIISIKKWINDIDSVVAQSYDTNISQIANILANIIPNSIKGNSFMVKIIRSQVQNSMGGLKTENKNINQFSLMYLLEDALPIDIIQGMCNQAQEGYMLVEPTPIPEEDTQALGESLGYKYMNKLSTHERKVYIMFMERYRLLESRSEFAYDKWSKDSTIKYATDLQLDISSEMNDTKSEVFLQIIQELMNQVSEVILLLSQRNISKERYTKLFGQVALPEDYNY